MVATTRANPIRKIAAPSTEARLEEALETLLRPGRGVGKTPKVTATALCRLAGVSRNSLYRYHVGILNALRNHQHRRHPTIDTRIGRRRSETGPRRGDLKKLAALVDHYYAAFREVSRVLERRERELAELRRQIELKPIAIRH